MGLNILVVKETRANERRVSLIPRDAEKLIQQGHILFVEHDAGLAAGFSDQAYQQVGATIRELADETQVASYQTLFAGIDVIVRAKRPDSIRESLENKALIANTVMIGALDPLERHSTHQAEYRLANIRAYSIDQLALPADDPLNILAAMSKMAGKLALRDALDKLSSLPKKVVIIGFGTVGQSAFHEAIAQHLLPSVVVHKAEKIKDIETQGGIGFLLDNHLPNSQQQAQIKKIVLDADVVITSARSYGQPAPMLITSDTLNQMKNGSVIVDMALSEGGNVEGSEHDATKILGNGIIVTNTSGYPKSLPHEASVLWSQASLQAIWRLEKGDPVLESCLI